MAKSILIGTRGWDHPGDSRDGGGRAASGTAAGWSGGFYPDVLPPDWRFSFYCNQLRSVLVPAEAWSAPSAAEVRAWAEDAFPEFRFVVELSATSPLSLDILEPIRSQVAGLLLRAPATPDRDWLAARLAGLTASFPLCVDLPPDGRTPDLLACLTQYDAGLCWRTEIEPEPHPGGKLMVALASAAVPSARGERSFGNGRMAAGMNDITLGAWPPSPNGRHRAWRERFRRWWPGDSEKTVPCGEPALPFEGASPRKGVALSPREPAAAPKVQRRWLERLAAWQREDGQAALFFDDPESAKQARLLAELMVV